MKSQTTRGFWKCFASLPTSVQKTAVRAYQQFRIDPRHPSLQFKKIEGTTDTYSARVSLGYRAVGTMRGDLIIWYWIGSHAEYDALIRK